MAQQDRHYSLSQYPLSWPAGWERTKSYAVRNARFVSYGKDPSIMEGLRRIFDELKKMGISKDDVLVSTNIPTRLDGMPRSDQREPQDRGVAVYWRKSQKAPMQCMAIDIYSRVADNLCAVAATLEALRVVERHGGQQVQERSFQGFAVLPAQAVSSRSCWEVLGINRAVSTAATVNAAYRQLAIRLHSDHGGSDAAMAELNVARDAALEELGGNHG